MKSEAVFGSHHGGSVIGSQWVEASNAAEHSTYTGQLPTTKYYLALNINRPDR